MNHPNSMRRALAPLLALALVCSLCIPASAFFWNKKEETATVSDFSKNGLFGQVIAFSQEDFTLKTDNKAHLTAIKVDSLPDPGAGILTIGGQPLALGTVVDASALSGLRFQSLPAPTVTQTQFTFTPSLNSGADCGQTTVSLYLLSEENQAPIAKNMELSTYKNVAITGYFDAVDTEGDTLTFQLTSTPARGAVTLAEDGSSQFVYTPYENKTGKDSFTYVAVDPAGNTSPEAKVSVRIDKADTKVTYADMEGNPAYKASIRLAEKGVFVGQYVNGNYFFDPNRPVSRAEFLTMAMAVSDLEPMQDVVMTGFSDDEAIPTWAKGSVSAALKAGIIQGAKAADGAPVFGATTNITRGEATVMLNHLLNISDVPLQVFSSEENSTHWAGQAAANLAASGVIRPESTGAAALSSALTRADVAELLDGAMDVLSAREGGGWFR